MSVDHLPAEQSKSRARDAKLVGYDEYIDTQIQQTRRMVKSVDIATALVVLATGSLVYLLIVAAAEHWLVPGGFGTLERSLLFAIFVFSVGQHAYRRLWPLIARPINPVFAAQTIERSSPSLKNSLLNLLLFRQQRTEITDAVYETLEEQAAQRLTRVPVEAAVDRSQLIRLGYTLVAVVAVCALYKIFSPKDPVIAVERVLMPWADIVPASRVSITNIEPGSTTLARGEMLPISAEVSGVGEDDPVVVRYTTADGQAVEKAVVMKPSATGVRYTAQLPAAAEPGRPTGVSQNLRYRIEAGDARSHVYAVTVVAAPTITVERVDYDYPSYTGIADRSVESLGDIRGIEGTRVTIHARANGPIDEAGIDFEADGRRDVRMTADGDEARASFVLALRDDHQTPKYTSYALRFKGTDGRTNHDPVKYPIDVLPDYAPEVAILAPKEKVRDVRLDETVTIDVEARDPDFALSDVRLKGDASGHTVLDEPLLSKEHSGRFAGRFQFTPNERGLKVGDELRYWVTARDNRTPQPNEAASEPQTLRIALPGPNQQQLPDRLAQREQRPPQPGDQQQGPPQVGGDQGNQQQQPGDGKQSSDGSQRNQPQSGTKSRDQNDGQKSANKLQGDKSDGGQPKDGESKGDSSKDGESKDGSPKDGASSGAQNGKKQSPQEEQHNHGKDSQQQQQPGGSESGGGHDKSQKQPGQPSAGGGDSGEKNSESGPSGEGKNSRENQGGSKGQRRDGANGKSGDSSSPKDQHDSNGGSGASGSHEHLKPSDSPSQVSPEGDNDGEAFDRIQKFLQRQGELRDPSGSDRQPKDEQQSSGDGQSGKPGSGAKAQSSGGKTPPSEGTNGAEKSPADGQNSAQQAEKSRQSEQQKQSADGKSASEKQPREGAKDDKENQSKQGGEASNKEQQNGNRSEKGRQGENQTDQGQEAEDAVKGAPAKEQPGKNARGSDKDTGSIEQPGSEKGADQQSADKQINPQMPKGQPAQSKGENGAGEPNQHDKGSPDVNRTMNPTKKWQQSPSNEKKSGDGDDASSGAKSKRESDSQSEQSGTESGGGKQGGGGQSAPHEGTGSSGQNQSADEGTGESSEHGKGHNSPSAGKDAKSDDRTGQSGSNEVGNGSGQRDGQGDKPGGKPNDAKQQNDQGNKGDNSQGGQTPGDDKQSQGKPGGKPADQSNKGSGQSQPNAKQPPGSQPAQSGGNSGQSSSNVTPGAPLGAGGPNKTDSKAPEADAANLEYARKRTDLVLETLAEQMKRKKVDKGLLDELGWSEKDLQRFLERWQQLKQAARDNTPAADAAQKELDDALRSLGLAHGPMQQSKVTEDKVRDLREGYHGPVPLEYQERLRAYNQGVSRARQDGE